MICLMIICDTIRHHYATNVALSILFQDVNYISFYHLCTVIVQLITLLSLLVIHVCNES